jgi:hypothetical protein
MTYSKLSKTSCTMLTLKLKSNNSISTLKKPNTTNGKPPSETELLALKLISPQPLILLIMYFIQEKLNSKKILPEMNN